MKRGKRICLLKQRRKKVENCYVFFPFQGKMYTVKNGNCSLGNVGDFPQLCTRRTKLNIYLMIEAYIRFNL